MFRMKKLLQVVLVVLMACAVLLTGCTGKPQAPTTEPSAATSAQKPKPDGGKDKETTATENTTAAAENTEATSPTDETEPPQTQPVTEPEIALTVDVLRRQLEDQGKRFAVAYLGYMTYTDETVWDFLDNRNYDALAALPCLGEVPDTNICCTAPYGEVYCILPVDPEAQVTVYGWETDDGENFTYDRLVYEGTGAAPTLVVCNTSFNPDFLVSIDFSDGTTYEWFPQLDDYYFVMGYWGGEMSDSMDGYDTLDVSPYHHMLLADYYTMLNAEDGTDFAPTAQDLIGTGWYEDGYDLNGNYYMYKMLLDDGTMDVYWCYGETYEVYEYQDAPWTLEHRDGVAVLTVDFGYFAGVKSYNLLMSEGMIYTAVDATGGPIANQWERQYRFLLTTEVSREVEDALGSWTRAYTEVEGDFQENDLCSVVIFGSAEEGYRIWLEDYEFPEWNLEDAELYIESAGDEGWLEGCPWVGVVESDALFSRRVALREDGSLVIQYYWEQEGAPMVSYSYFERG